MFLNIEIKKEHAGVDPLVQLAVWTAAEFKKRAFENYDRSMPVLAIVISGYTWELYIVYEPEFHTVDVEELVNGSWIHKTSYNWLDDKCFWAQSPWATYVVQAECTS